MGTAMQVLHIIFDDNVGAERAVALCAAGVKSGAFTPVAACLEGSAPARLLDEAGVRVLPLPSCKTWYPGVWRRVVRAWRTYNFSVVHTHDALAARLGLKCRQSWLQARWAHTWWTPPVFRRDRDLDRFKLADLLIGLNQEAVRHLESGGADPARLRAIPTGIDSDVYPARIEDETGRLKLAALAPLVPDSGHETLLEALALFKSANPDLAWELRLAGEGALFDSILRRAGVWGIAEHMAFLGPQQSCNILPQCDILTAVDLRGENGCEAIKRAWAVGLPVLCSDLPVHVEMVRDGVNGLVAPRHDAVALSARLGDLWADPELRHKLAQGGRESLANYTLEHMVTAYAHLYTELVAGTGTGQVAEQV